MLASNIPYNRISNKNGGLKAAKFCFMGINASGSSNGISRFSINMIIIS
jgi:hypothetical protein